MAGSDLANSQSLVNICANFTEIAALVAGCPLLLLSFIPSASGLRGYSLKIAGMAVALIIVGAATPAIINFLVGLGEMGMLTGLVIGGLTALFALIAVGLTLFLPTIIAFLEKKTNKTGIVILNVIGCLIPLCGLIAYIWACMPEKRDAISIDDRLE